MYKRNIHLIIIYAVNKLFINGALDGHVYFVRCFETSRALALTHFGGDFVMRVNALFSFYFIHFNVHTHSTLGHLPDRIFILLCVRVSLSVFFFGSHSCTYVLGWIKRVRMNGTMFHTQPHTHISFDLIITNFSLIVREDRKIQINRTWNEP